MKAPTKQRSMNATKRAERRVLPSRTSVAMAQAQARMETIKRTRMKEGVSWLFELKPATNHDCDGLVNELRYGREEESYQHANHRDEGDDLSQSPEGEQETSEHDGGCVGRMLLRVACITLSPECWSS